MVYFVIFFAILICVVNFDAFYYVKKRHVLNHYGYHYKLRRQVFNLIICVLIVICGLRYRVGTDTIVYMDEYNLAIDHLSDRYQIGWILLLKLFKMVNANFYIVQFFIASIINVGVCRYIEHSKRGFVFSGLLLYYTLLFPGWNFEILRQSIGISLFLVALPYLRNRVLIYLIIICIASTIHETALMLLLVPLLVKIRLNKFLLLCFSSVILIIILLAPFLKEQFIQLAISISFLQDRAAFYYGQMDDDVSFSFVSYVFNIMLNIVAPIAFIFLDGKNKYNSNEYYVLCLLSIFTYALSMMIPMIYRVNYYFTIFTLFLYIDIFRWIVCALAKKRYARQLLYVFLLISFVGVKARIYWAKNDDGIPMYVHYYPYTNVFNEYIVQDRENLVVY